MGLFGMFSQKNTADKIQEYLKNGAVVLDVRTHAEWNEDHIDGAKHIVLNTIPENLEEIKSYNKPVIAVCKSGGRSQSATDFLSQNGLDVINGGPWQNVAQFID
ncbi:MAG: rhodanese-like domain-containing protein [Flavobacteriaceae bacterium]|nr:rhodanese-like domain-containing protein [Flavobacteriaceae bacterium]